MFTSTSSPVKVKLLRKFETVPARLCGCFDFNQSEYLLVADVGLLGVVLEDSQKRHLRVGRKKFLVIRRPRVPA